MYSSFTTSCSLYCLSHLTEPNYLCFSIYRKSPLSHTDTRSNPIIRSTLYSQCRCDETPDTRLRSCDCLNTTGNLFTLSRTESPSLSLVSTFLSPSLDNTNITEYVAQSTSDVIRISDDPLDTPPLTPSSDDMPTSSWWERKDVDDELPDLADFIRGLAAQSNVQMPTLSVTLVYLSRLREKLPAVATGEFCPCLSVIQQWLTF